MRHIPDDELHAYLDQALSRSQCVEIECHLAECRQCQIDRDRVAAIRDRTTALLSQFRPPRTVAPPFEVLVARHQEQHRFQVLMRLRTRKAALWAASLIGAVGAGWGARLVMERSPAAAAKQVVVASAPAQLPVARELTAITPVQPVGHAAAPATALRQLPAGTREVASPGKHLGLNVAPAAVQVTALDATNEDVAVALDGLWQSVDLDEARSLIGSAIPRVEGMPILDIQLQRGSAGERPLIVVSQRHPSGEIIRTIEGPTQRVTELLQQQAVRSPGKLHSSDPSRTQPDYLDDGAAARRANRIMTVTGLLPVDSLNLLARNISARE